MKKIFIGLILVLGLLSIGIVSSASQTQLFKYRHYYFKFFQPNNVNELLRRAYQTFKIPKQGLIHIGARYAEEMVFYRHHGIDDILWIEADPEAEATLKQKIAKYPRSKLAMFAATDSNGFIDLNKTSNDGHSSSILKLKDHLTYYPDITVQKIIRVPQKRLDDYFMESPSSLDVRYNFLVMDIQGAELIALKGSVNTLKNIDAIITETNYDELYEKAAFIKELDDFLAANGFIRVDSSSCTHYTGDALYVKTKFLGVG